jgi:hypothetical protein
MTCATASLRLRSHYPLLRPPKGSSRRNDSLLPVADPSRRSLTREVGEAEPSALVAPPSSLALARLTFILPLPGPRGSQCGASFDRPPLVIVPLPSAPFELPMLPAAVPPAAPAVSNFAASS